MEKPLCYKNRSCSKVNQHPGKCDKKRTLACNKPNERNSSAEKKIRIDESHALHLTESVSEKLNDLKEKVENAERRLFELDVLIEEKNVDIENLNHTISVRQEQLKDLNENINKCETLLVDKQNILDGIEKGIECRKKGLAIFNLAYNAKQGQLEQIKQSINYGTNEIENLRTSSDELSKCISEKKFAVENLDQNLKQHELKLNKLQLNINEQLKINEELEKKCKDLSNKHAYLTLLNFNENSLGTLRVETSEEMINSRHQKSTRYKRRAATEAKLRSIHGSLKGATIGAWDFLSKNVDTERIEELLSSFKRGKLLKKLIKNVANKHAGNDDDSMKKAVAMRHVIAKSRRLYQYYCKLETSVYCEESHEWKLKESVTGNTPISDYKINKHVKGLDIGEVYPLDGACGVYRTISSLCHMIINLTNRLFALKQNLIWFKGNENHFIFEFSDDGAPEKKDGSMSIGTLTPWNLGSLVRSRNYNYLLHSVSVPEKDQICNDLWLDHSVEMRSMEGNIFVIDGKRVTVEFQPSADMAWQMHIAGELNSAAVHPSPYAHNLHKSELGLMNKSVGHKETDTWQPPTEESRTRDLKLLNDYRATLSDQLTDKARHDLELEFMAKNTIRQLREPVIGMYYANLLRPEPLHMEINAFEHLLNLMYQEADKQSKIDAFLLTLKNSIEDKGCGLNSVAKSVRDHYDCEETRSNKLQIRLIGEQAIKLAKYGYRLADIFAVDVSCGLLRIKYLVICKLVETLRDIGSLINRISVSEIYPSEVQHLCTLYHNLIALFFTKNCNVTVWNVGYALPYHVQVLYDKIGIGYGITSMQGKESKHSGIKKMLKSETNQSNNSANGKWMQVHRLCYIKDFYLHSYSYLSHFDSRVPSFSDDEPRCRCSRVQLDGFSCDVCTSVQKIVENAVQGSIDPEVEQVLKPYLCQKCSERFPDITLYDKHRSSMHNLSKVQAQTVKSKRVNVKKLSKSELKQHLEEVQLSTLGTKETLQKRLERHYLQHDW